jgi:hypothetical protein
VVRIEVPALDFAMEAGLLAVFLGLVVLLPLFEEPVRGIVVSYALGGFEWVGKSFWRGAVSIS